MPKIVLYTPKEGGDFLIDSSCSCNEKGINFLMFVNDDESQIKNDSNINSKLIKLTVDSN